MKYRSLGGTGILISEIGFGAWGIGGATPGPTSYGSTDDKNSQRALSYAFENGITLYDTSNVYGNGHSEVLIGRTFKANRDKVVITTKAGLNNYFQPLDFSSTNLRNSLEESLKRLQADYVDLLLLHNPPNEIIEESERLLSLREELLQEGKIRAFGLSVRVPEDGLWAIDHLQPDALQVNFNLLDQRIIECGLLERAQEAGTSIIARTPLCFGFLSGNFTEDISFDASDHRSRWPRKQIRNWVRGVNLMLACKEDSISQTAIQFALRYCLSFSQIVSVLPGMLTETEVLENVQAQELGPLTQTELESVAKTYQEVRVLVESEELETVRSSDPGKTDG